MFDPKTVKDRATFLVPNQTSVGMRFVLVNGVSVIRQGELVKSVSPGKAIRRPRALAENSGTEK